MNYVNMFFGMLWRRKSFFAVMLSSSLLFFIWFFPFSDLSQVITSQIYAGSGNSVYVQFETLDLSLLPKPAISGRGVSIETMLPPLQADWAKISPSLLNLLLNINTLHRAGTGDLEAQRAALTRLGFSFAAEGLLGAEVDFDMRPGSTSERGAERSRISLMVDGLDLKQVQEWIDLPMKIQGRAALETDMQIAPDFQDQPEGDFNISAQQFNMPAATLMMPFEGAQMPVNLPTLTLENILLKGRLVNGALVIEEGRFGQEKDPLYGRIKGQLAVRMLPSRGTVQAVPGDYNLTVDLTATSAFEKEFSYLKLFLDQAKTPVSGGTRYLFKISGRMGGFPVITRLSSF